MSNNLTPKKSAFLQIDLDNDNVIVGLTSRDLSQARACVHETIAKKGPVPTRE